MSFGETSIFIKQGHTLAAGMKLFNKRFQLERPLGSGGMGQVWLAQDTTLGQPRAMKFIATALMQDQGAKRRLMQEALAGTTLSHPRIVRVYDYMEDVKRGISAIIMECVAGKTLAELLGESAHGFLEPDQIHQHIMDVADGLRYAHEEKKRYHLDIKPSNIIIDSADGHARLLDFGISRTAKDATTRITGGNSSGTLPYMSPQQMNGDTPGAADDYYGLAATVYELLTGTPPFFRGEIGHQVQHRPVERIAERRRKNCVENLVHRTGGSVPEPWEQLITGWLSKDPAQRLATLSMLDLAQGRLPQAAATAAAAKPAAARPPAWRRYLLPATAAAGVALAAAATAPLWPGRAPEVARRPLKSSKDLEIERRLEEERQQREAAEERQRLLEEELLSLKTRQMQESTTTREAEIQQKAAELAAAQLKAREEEQARQRAEADRAARLAAETITPGTAFHISGLGLMSWIPEGEFMMGSGQAERQALAATKDWNPAKVADEVPHRVHLTQGYWLAADEVTLEQYLAFLNDTAAPPGTVFTGSQRWIVQENPCCPVEYTGSGWRLRPAGSPSALFWSSPRQPMVCVTWHGARAFCEWFTRMATKAGKLPPGWVFSLPTEAQWEHACRGGTTSMYSFGGSISSTLANFDTMQPIGSALPARSLGHPHPTAAARIASAAPGAEVRVLRSSADMLTVDAGARDRLSVDHPWWLRDMHGNVWEWCHDWYGDYDTAPISTDPTGPAIGSDRVLRGGGWKSPGWACRSAVRNYCPPAGGEGDEETGFRAALIRVKN